MMTTTDETVAPEILPYLKALRHRLAGLPEEERLDLLADLETHLEEIVSEESEGSLADRIGTPAAYADEFASSIGIDDAPEPSRSVFEALSAALRSMGDHAAFDRAKRLWNEMRPAWWAIRGLAIGLLLMWEWFSFGNPYGTPVVRLLAWVIVIGVVGSSMRIGHNQERSAGWKWLSVGVTVAGIVAGMMVLGNLSHGLSYYYSQDQYMEMAPYERYQEGYYPYGEYGPSIEDLERMIAEGAIAPPVTTSLPPPDAPLIITP